MKKTILTLLFISMFFTYEVFSQTTTNPDTVCVNATGEIYFVNNTVGSTYNWAVTSGGGTIQSGQGTNSISIDWGAVPGLYPGAVTITETDINGCVGAPVVLDVFILEPIVTQIGPFCEGDPCVTLTGTPVGGVWTGTGVVLNGAVYEFCPATSGTGTFTLTYTVGGCSVTMDVTVNPTPITGPINHY